MSGRTSFVSRHVSLKRSEKGETSSREETRRSEGIYVGIVKVPSSRQR